MHPTEPELRSADSRSGAAVVRILVGTGNAHKLDEIAGRLTGQAGPAGVRLEVVGPAGLAPASEVEESGETFEANARLKAEAFADRAAELDPPSRPEWVIADDSGLRVDSLGGLPGVRSARFAGESASDRDNNDKLLRSLEGVPSARRGAEFVCVIVGVQLPRGGGRPRVAFSVEGTARGEILTAPRGTSGFGYDPLFLVPELGRTFAELSQAEKSAVSHRGRALEQLRARLVGELSASRRGA